MPANTGAQTRTITVDGMRVLPSDNPEVMAVVKGFVKGKAFSRAIPASLRGKVSINQAKGTLTLPVGKRGRRATPGLSQDAINALLAG